MACVAVIRGFLPDGEHVPVFAGSVFKGHLTHSPVDHREGLRVMPVFGSKRFPAGLRVLVQRAARVGIDAGDGEAAGLQQCREPEGPGRGGGVDRDIPAGQRFGSLRQRLFGFVFVGVQQSCTDDGRQADALAGTGGVDRRRDLFEDRPFGAVDLVEVPAVRHFQERSPEPFFQVFAGRLPEGVGVEVQRGVRHLLVFFIGLHPGQVIDFVPGEAQEFQELGRRVDREIVPDDVDRRRGGGGSMTVYIAHRQQALVQSPVGGGLVVGLGRSHGAVHVALDEEDVREALFEFAEDERHIRVHELVHAGVEDEADGRVLPVPFVPLPEQVRHALDEEGLHAGADPVLLLDDHQREPGAEAAELRGRQGDAPQTALRADVDLHTLRYEQGSMGDGPRPAGGRGVFEAGPVRPVGS